ncbi:hypothetical protein [Streptomyces sp. MNP-20]|uniref:hypothetical protein n=1 Tax=Streptomyces sp. MNP-20 TaxID=2721165 RepID=UPI0015579EDB|nr:hypothetical protein [Streptomyces sp. MNP-20]
MHLIHDVPDDWNPGQRCCLECGNSDVSVTLRAITHQATNQQALACTRHIADVAAVLDSFARIPQPPITTGASLPTPPQQPARATLMSAPPSPPQGTRQTTRS